MSRKATRTLRSLTQALWNFVEDPSGAVADRRDALNLLLHLLGPASQGIAKRSSLAIEAVSWSASRKKSKAARKANEPRAGKVKAAPVTATKKQRGEAAKVTVAMSEEIVPEVVAEGRKARAPAEVEAEGLAELPVAVAPVRAARPRRAPKAPTVEVEVPHVAVAPLVRKRVEVQAREAEKPGVTPGPASAEPAFEAMLREAREKSGTAWKS